MKTIAMGWYFFIHLGISVGCAIFAWIAARRWKARGFRSIFFLCLSLGLMNLSFALLDLWQGIGGITWAHLIILVFSILALILAFFHFREIKLMQQIDQELKESEANFRVLFENGPDAIMLTDLLTQEILDCNENACRMNGRKREEMIGFHANMLHQEDTATMVNDDAFREKFYQAVSSGKSFSVEAHHRNPDGSLRVIETNMSLVSFRGKRALMGIDRDITDRKLAEQQVQKANETLAAQLAENQNLQEMLREQALRDPLTGIYNRRFLQETLDHELARARRDQLPLSLMMLDVDYFKKLNDTHGHAAGDLVLQAIAELLQKQFREMDVPCRYGGEEFLIAMPTADCQAALKRAENLRQLIEALRIPCNGEQLQVTVSIGVACFPEHAGTTDELSQSADKAMYAAKQAGRNTVCMAAPITGETHR